MACERSSSRAYVLHGEMPVNKQQAGIAYADVGMVQEIEIKE